jgi:hypothetical protein
MTTVNDEQTAQLGALKNQKERVLYACEHMPAKADTENAEVMAWLEDRGHPVPRQTSSKYLNAWKRSEGHPVKGNTAQQSALTPGRLARMDEERGFVGTPQENTLAGVEGSYNMDRATADDFAPRSDAPVSPAVSTPPAETSRPAVAPSLPPVMSDPRRVAPVEADAPAPRVAPRDTDAPASVTADASHDVSIETRQAPDATIEDGATLPQKEEPSDSDRPSWRARMWTWLVAKFVWIQYVGLLQVAAFGLFQVLNEGAGMPMATAIGGAAAIELVGISLKILADGAERKGESHRVVRVLLVISGAIAVAIGAINAIGHAQMPADGEGNPIIAAALFGTASIAGYALWTVSSTLGHRARMRYLGQLEGPGLRIPAYIRDRYGVEVADRAQKLSRFNARLSIAAAVDQARAELESEEREARETERRNALRAGLIAHAKATHDDQLAADMESSRFSADTLSDRFTASVDEHDAKVKELLDWMSSHKK